MKSLAMLALQLLLVSGCLALPMQRVETDPELTAGYVEGDMVIDSMERNILRNETLRWPNRIVFYYINSYIDEDHRNHILRAIRIIEEYSCIIFKEATSDQPYYVNVTSEPGGCFSTVGFRNRVQQLNLQDNTLDIGCFRLGTIVHEFLHALGFYHQQSASNRDDYVRIVEENIQEGTIHNFNKYNETVVTDFEQEYDYASIMHYPPYAFSANGKMTIEPLQEGAEEVMGQRVKMTDTDVNKLNLMYKCPRYV